MPDQLTDRQRAILVALRRYAAEHGGRAPSLRELQRLCGISSTSVAAYNLERLAALGYITLGNTGESRSARLVEQTSCCGGVETGEIKLLRELFEDVERWRESGDARDLRYVLDTADRIAEMRQV